MKYSAWLCANPPINEDLASLAGRTALLVTTPTDPAFRGLDDVVVDQGTSIPEVWFSMQVLTPAPIGGRLWWRHSVEPHGKPNKVPIGEL